MLNRHFTFKGMTTFEVIIAIIVFGTGILVILSMLTKNISWLSELKQRDTATMLAKEALEITYNLRDTNSDKWIIWSCTTFQTGAVDNCWNYFHETSTWESYFQVDRNTTWGYTLTEIPATGSSRMYLYTWTLYSTSWDALWSGFWYSHATWGVQTPYRRYLVFRPVISYEQNTWNILAVESHVEYTVGSQQKAVVLESLIGKTR